jgi:hypothetical protein
MRAGCEGLTVYTLRYADRYFRSKPGASSSAPHAIMSRVFGVVIIAGSVNLVSSHHPLRVKTRAGPRPYVLL